jgi:2-polyprenyl-6-methoxyphenol hydroxylase-like FAD-dependent oxidoreductase
MKRVLISGAGVAGPALALCLSRYGIRSVVVERSSVLREGGQAVDFRGPIHQKVLRDLNLWESIQERRTQPSALTLLDTRERTIATLPEVMMSGDVEILRGDLVRILYERTASSTDYLFGDRITSLQERSDGVEVCFESQKKEEFSLVIGADGLHSGVRALAFGEESRFLRHHGYRLATFSARDVTSRAEGAQMYSHPGRAASLFFAGGTPRALLIYVSPPMRAPEKQDVTQQKRELREVFSGMRWELPGILSSLEGASDLYVDDISTVHLERYWRGRVALLGDAAYGGTLGGQGTSLAIVGAYVLAGELARASTHEEAFSRYDAVMRGYATGCQKGAMHVGSFFAPKSGVGLWFRNKIYRALTSRLMLGFFTKLVKESATNLKLPEYQTPKSIRDIG